MIYVVIVEDIEEALLGAGGELSTRSLQDQILQLRCGGVVPENYKNERTFRMTVQRKIEDYCPQAAGWNQSGRTGKFLRVGYGVYRIAAGHEGKEIPAIEEVESAEEFSEGATKTIAVNYFERDPEARRKCIAHYGLHCVVCGFDFERSYGVLGAGFAHVHHIVPLAEIRQTYKVDPVRDLRPVCANCHAVIHRTSPALSIEQLAEAVKAVSAENRITSLAKGE